MVNAADEPLAPDKRTCSVRTLFCVAFFILALSFLCFSQCLFVGLLADDFTYLNLLCLHPLEILWQGFSGSHMLLPVFGQHYRPALTIFYLIDCWLFGTNPSGLHFSNIVWHSCACFLSFLAVLKVLKAFAVPNRFLVSLWSSIIFTIHPFHCEAVAWWVSKNDIINSTFYLLSFVLFLEGRESKKLFYRLASPLVFFIALACKEAALTLPFVLFTFLFILDRQEKIAPKCLSALRSTAPFWLVLLLFWLLRWFVLGTCLGGYYGHLNGFWLAVLQKQYTDLRCLSSIWLPVDTGSSLWDRIAYTVLAIVYAFAFLSFPRKLDEPGCKNSIAALSFASLAFLVIMIPACFVWYPDPNFENSRLLYLAVLPISMLLPLLLLARPRHSAWAFMPLSLFVLILLSSSIHFQTRWLSASNVIGSLRQALEYQLARLPKAKQLMVFDLPSYYEKVPLRIQFMELQDMLRPPFASRVNWQRLRSLSPHYFGDRELINLSRLKEVADNPGVYELFSCREGLNGLAMKETDLPGLAKPAADQKTPVLAALDQGVRQGCRYSFVRLEPPIDPTDFQFLKIRFKQNTANKKLRAIYWKTPEMQSFASENHCRVLRRAEKDDTSQKEFVHLGELVDWLLCKRIAALEIVSDKDCFVDSVMLRSDLGLVPQLRALTPASDMGADGILMARPDGNLYFQFDASQLPGASSIRVEITQAASEFNYYTGTYRDSRECPWRLRSFDIDSAKGQFALSNRLASPVWHQLRIFARSREGTLLGFSSDPIYVQSEPGKTPDSSFKFLGSDK